MTRDAAVPLNPTEFHVLLVLADGPLYGYAILKAVEANSGGRVAPEVGTLYRVLSRLEARGWLAETGAPAGSPEATRGQPRRYYRLTPAGLAAARAEAGRLGELVALAASVLPGGGS